MYVGKRKPVKRPPLMSHEERRKLIEAPISFRVIPGYRGAGTSNQPKDFEWGHTTFDDDLGYSNR